MKLRNLFLASLACAGLFTACSNEIDETIDNNGNQQEQVEAEAYASFSFAMPAGANTRATAGEVVGSEQENKITNAKIILFNTDGSVVQDAVNLSGSAFDKTTTGNVTTYTTKENVAITKTGTYIVHVIVNPTPAFNTIKDYATYKAAIEAVAKGTGAYCTDNNFLMTNAYVDAESTVEIKNTHIKTAPAKVNVHVERMAAKVVFEPTAENKYTIADKANFDRTITVTFDAYKVINTRSNAYGLRRVGTNFDAPTVGGPEIIGANANYVFDNIFDKKTSFEQDAYNTNYSRKYNTYVAFRNLKAGTAQQPLAYCLENTMTATAQLNGWSTGVILRGKLNISGQTTRNGASEGDIYKYDGKLYTSLTALVKGTDPGWNGENNTNGLVNDVLNIKSKIEDQTVEAYLTSINDITKLYALNVEKFDNGYCYYTTWLRHNNNDSDDMGIMEFAIVRNNVYQLSIKSVGKIGSISSGTPGAPDPTKPADGQEDVPNGGTNPEIPGTVAPNPEPVDPVIPFEPTNPDESKQVFLEVAMKVLPWTVRKNAVDL